MNYPSRHHNNAKGTTRDVNAGKRVQQAIQLRAERVTFEEIAARCGYGSRGAAHHAVMRELDRCVTKDVEELRTQELHMLDVMHREVWQLFMDKKNRGRLFAVDRLLAISERRSKLMGLDLSNDNAIAAAQIIVQEVPSRYLTGPAPVAEVEG